MSSCKSPVYLLGKMLNCFQSLVSQVYVYGWCQQDLHVLDHFKSIRFLRPDPIENVTT